MEVARLQVAFEATGQGAIQSAVKQTDRDITNLAKNSERSAGRIGQAFSLIGKGIAFGFGVVAAQGLIDVGKGFLTANASAEQYRIQLETVTGSQERANALFKDLQQFAKDTPFEFPELVQASAQLESFGLQTEAWIKTIGDTASGTGKTVDQVTQAVLDVQGNQFERLKELGILASVEGDKLKLSYMENGKQVVETVDKNNKEIVNSTLQAIWNRKYEGAMKKQSKTFNGQLSTLKDNINMTMQKATLPIFNFAKDGLDAANRFFDRFNDKMAQGFSVWEAATRSLHTTLNQTFGRAAGDAIIGVIDGIGSAIGTVIDVAGGLIEAFGAGRGVAAIFRDLPEPLRGAAEALGSVADALGDLWRGYQQGGIGELFSRLGEEAKQIGEAGIDLGVILVKATFELAKGIVTNIWDWFKGQLGLGGNRFGGIPVVGAAAGAVANQEVSIGTVLVTAGLALGGQIKEWAGNLWGWVKGQLGLGPNAGAFAGIPVVGGAIGAQNTIDIGDVLVDVGNLTIGNIAGWASDAASRIQSWLDTNDPGSFTQVVNLTEIIPSLDAAAKGQYQEALKGLLEADPIRITPPIEANITRQSFRFTRKLFDIDLTDLLNVRIDWKVALAPLLLMNPAGAIAAVVAKIFGPDVAKAIAAAFKGAFAAAYLEGAGIAAQLGAAITTGVRALDNWGNDILIAFAEKIVVSGTNFVQEGQNIAKQIAAAIILGTNANPNWGSDLLLGFAKKIVVTGDNFIAEGKAIADQIGAAIQTGVNALNNFDFSGLASNIATALVKYITPDIIEGAISSALTGDTPDASKALRGGAGSGPMPLERDSFTPPALRQLKTGTNADMQAPMIVPPPDLSGFNKALATIFPTVTTNMTAATAGATAGSQTLSQSVISTVSAMVPRVTGQLAAMVGNVRSQFAAMVASGQGQMAAFSSSVASAFAAMTARAIGSTSSMVGSVISIIGGLASSGASVAYSAGIAIGAGLANGLAAMVGQVAAQAAALANTAAAAVAAAAQIRSPSRVFARFGEQMGAGLVAGLMGGRGDAAFAGTALARAAMPAYAGSMRNAPRRSAASYGATYIIQGDLLGQRDWERRVNDLAERGAVTVFDKRSTSARQAGR